MKRFIITAAVVIILIVSYVYFIRPLPEKRASIKESLEVKYATLQKYERFMKNIETTEIELGSAEKKLGDVETHILKDKTESLAFAKLQGHIQDFAAQAGMRIISIKPLSVVKYKNYTGLPIQLEASGGIKQLGEFMRQIDTAKQLICIDKFNVNVMNMQMPDEMRIRMQVSGLMQETGKKAENGKS